MIGTLRLLSMLPAFGTVVFVAAAIAVAIGFAWLLFRRPVARSGRDPVVGGGDERVHMICEEARTIVDLVTLTDRTGELPSTATLSKVATRIRRLDGRLHRLRSVVLSDRILEAAEDMRRVLMSLSAALEVERAIRLGPEADRLTQRALSAERIAERAAELDLVTEELHWLSESS